MSGHQHRGSRPRQQPAHDDEDHHDDERLKRARALTTPTTMAPPVAAAAATRRGDGDDDERPLASIAVRTLFASQQQQQNGVSAPPATNPAVTVSQPVQLGCWTKASRLSGLPQAQRFAYGDRRGLPRLRLPSESALPLSLDEGYPERFVRKEEGERSGVEAVVRGAQHPSTAPSPAAVLAAAQSAAKSGAGGAGDGGEADEVAAKAAAANPKKAGGVDWSCVHVCTYRNNLNKILGVPIDTSARADGWCIDAVLLAPAEVEDEARAGARRWQEWGGGEAAAPPAVSSSPSPSPSRPHRVLFLDIQPDPGGERTFPGQDRFMYYGYKLETICTEQPPPQQGGQGGGGAGRPHPPLPPPLVDSTSEYGALVAVRLGRHRVLMAAEMDAEEDEPEAGGPSSSSSSSFPSPLARLAEIKCYRPPPPSSSSSRAAETLFRLKHQRWWVQSFLAGVPTLVLGSRDDRGNLVAVQRVPVARLAEVSRRNGFPWAGDRLVGFGDAALAWMRRVAEKGAEEEAVVAGGGAGGGTGSGAGAHLRFRYDPRAGELRASVVRGGRLPERVRAALAERAAAAAKGG